MNSWNTLCRRVSATTFAFLILCLIFSAASAIELTPGSSIGSAPTISQGDPVIVHGTATGHPQRGLQVWLIGTNYVSTSTVSVNSDNTYSYELKPDQTRTLASGQYVVLIQHPMMNGQFDVVYDAATGNVVNKVQGGGTALFKLTGSGSLQSPNSATALMNAINSQNIDDRFVMTTFVIGSPSAFINNPGNHVVGDHLTISGSTNLKAGDELLVEITSASFVPTRKTQSGEFSGASGIVKVVPCAGSGMNCWSFEADTSAWKPDEYLIKVSGVTVDVTGSSSFTLTSAPVAAPSPQVIVPAATSTAMQTPPPTASVATTPAAAATPKAPLCLWGIVGAIVAAICLAGRVR